MNLPSYLQGKNRVLLAKTIHKLANFDFVGASLEYPLNSFNEEIEKYIAAGVMDACLESISKRLMANKSVEVAEVTIDESIEIITKSFRFEQIWEFQKSGTIPSDYRNALSYFKNELYREDLEQEIRCVLNGLVDEVHRFPGYQRWLLSRVVKTELRLDKFLDAHSMKAAAFEVEYRQELYNKLNHVELFISSANITDANAKQPHSIAYVKLRLNQKLGETNKIVAEADTLFNSNQFETIRHVILGPAGSGKTTLLKHFALVCSDPGKYFAQRIRSVPEGVLDVDDYFQFKDEAPVHDSNSHLAFKLSGFVPIFIRLRDFGELPSWDDAVLKNCVRAGKPMPPGWADEVVQSGRALILVDGLDEITPEKRADCVVQIEKLQSAWKHDPIKKRNCIFVTSRAEAVEQGCFADYNEHFVRELSYDDQVIFVKQWYRAVADVLQASGESQNLLNERRDLLLQKFSESGSLRKLAETPLLCSLLCALSRVLELEVDLPTTTYALCRESVDMLLRARDSKQQIKAATDYYHTVSLSQLRFVCRDIAYECLLNDRLVSSRQDILKVICDTMNFDESECMERSNEILDGIIRRSNLLRECGVDQVEFVHNSIRDYLASLRFVQDNDWRTLAQKVTLTNKKHWEQVCLFAAASETNNTFGKELLKEVVRVRS